MKECNLICGSFLAIQDGDSGEELRKETASHFRRCNQCRDEFAWYEFAVKAMTAIERVEPPKDFLRQLNHKLDQLRPPSYLDHIRDFFSFNTPRLPIPVGVGALVVCGLLALVLYNQGPFLNPSELWSNMPSEHTASSVVHNKGLHPEQRAIEEGIAAVAPGFTEPSLNPKSMGSRKLLIGTPKTLTFKGPTIADIVGADNLTVESLATDSAVESLKRTLARLNGRVLQEQLTPADGDVLLGVSIPSDAYGEMNTELINHGAVISGAGVDVHPPAKDNDHVKVYIRFTKPRP